MSSQIYINLAVKDLDRTKKFFIDLGFNFDPKFSDHNGACMIINVEAFVMFLTEPFFKTFIQKDLSDTATSTEVINALAVNSREAVDQMVNHAIATGGRAYKDPDDQGWMYGWGFEDPDGHLWEVLYMDPAQTPPSA